MQRDPRIDDYLAALPADQRAPLQHLRAEIAHAGPDAVETISYGMPAFRRRDRFLGSYAGWKSHCSFYPLTDSFLVEHEAQLAGYARTKGSLHFTTDKPLSDSLIKKLVQARLN